MSTPPVKEEPMEVEEPEAAEPPAAEEDPPAAAPAAAAAPEEAEDAAKDAEKAEETTQQERQLMEFNQWLYRWNNYQQTLANYWQGRHFALSLEAQSGGGKLTKKGKKGKKAGARPGKERAQNKWDLRFQELVDFKEEHGHCNVPKEYTYKFSPPLGHWVGRMRHLHKKGTLDAARVARLEAIEFQFVVERTGNMVNFSVVWDRSYRALKAFRDVNGHVEVPNGYKPQPDMAELDGWITRQRKHYKDGRLPDHLQSKLRELGLSLGGRGRPFGVESEDVFGKNYKALAEYAEHNGDCDVPEKYDANPELGAWVKSQRETFADGMIPHERVRQLQQIGFNFYHGRKKERKGEVSDPWERRLAELRAYREKTGDSNVPKKFALNLGLGEFVYNQRMAYKDGNLSEEKVKSLQELGFDFALVKPSRRKRGKTKWEMHFDELVEFKDKHGNFNIPPDYAPNPSLGTWLKRQIKYKREGIMKDPKYQRLKAIGVDFGGPKQEKKPWMEQYQALVEFNKEHGHTNVPVHYQENPALYYWLGTQRQTYKKGKLSDDKVALLEEIGFNFAIKLRGIGTGAAKKGTRGGNKPFLDPQEFDKLVGELNDYKEEHGTIDVPQRDGRLGSFVHYMRFYAKGGKLSQGQIDSLNELGFSWNVTSDRWNSKFELLSKFREKNGHFDIPSGHALYAWVGYQRKLYQDDNLPQSRVEMLDSIDFDFAIPVPKRGVKETPAQWEEKYQDLVAFQKEHGHCKVPQTYEASPDLPKWVAAQQKRYKKGSLSDNYVDRLNEIKFNYLPDTLPKLGVLKIPKLEPIDRESYLEGLWEKSYQELAKYKEHFGHCSIPISYEPNPSLGAWAFSQKMAHKKGKLTQDRFDKLNELGFPFGPPKVVAEV